MLTLGIGINKLDVGWNDVVLKGENTFDHRRQPCGAFRMSQVGLD